MYERCWIAPDSGLLLIAVVLAITCIGLVCGIVRQTESARKYRLLFNEASVEARHWKREAAVNRFQGTFGPQ